MSAALDDFMAEVAGDIFPRRMASLCDFGVTGAPSFEPPDPAAVLAASDFLALSLRSLAEIQAFNKEVFIRVHALNLLDCCRRIRHPNVFRHGVYLRAMRGAQLLEGVKEIRFRYLDDLELSRPFICQLGYVNDAV